MSLLDDTQQAVTAILRETWAPRSGVVVPEVDSVALRGEIVEISASVLFADLAHSTHLVRDHEPRFASNVIRVFLNVASRAIRHHGGEIRSFDGDRVMAVYIGQGCSESAVRSALRLNYLMEEVAIPRLKEYWTFTTDYTVGYGCGIDAGTLRVVRAGIRQNNDLVFVGYTTNVAAKLSQERVLYSPILITDGVYSDISRTNLLTTGSGSQVWRRVSVSSIRDKVIYGTSCTLSD